LSVVASFVVGARFLLGLLFMATKWQASPSCNLYQCDCFDRISQAAAVIRNPLTWAILVAPFGTPKTVRHPPRSNVIRVIPLLCKTGINPKKVTVSNWIGKGGGV